ncbi:acetate uptake transporter [Kyrpidia sp.]|uniref:acetate uptake transporter n=1 Tax=Kyrpidia sp. TaxID=2073077 RepID=UPI00183F263D|nr:acetate uptake transporter [Kyrpidia sp.]MCL6575586.1 acetate uptake transporter [Kyrpidia sp.]HHY67030.1 acetate uptake transporter [Alicyclobacillus sp.]
MASEVKITGISDPGPLGLAAFALTTFVLSSINAGLFPEAVLGTFLPLALFYGGLAQLLAGMWEFRTGNTFGATAFSSYGAFWMSLGTFVYLQLKGVLDFKVDAGVALGLFLLAWTIFTFYMWIGSFRTNKALITVFTLLFLTFVLLTVGAFGSVGATHVGGWLGILTAVVAWYTSAAGVINSTFGRTVLSVGAKPPGRQVSPGSPAASA